MCVYNICDVHICMEIREPLKCDFFPHSKFSMKNPHAKTARKKWPYSGKKWVDFGGNSDFWHLLTFAKQSFKKCFLHILVLQPHSVPGPSIDWPLGPRQVPEGPQREKKESHPSRTALIEREHTQYVYPPNGSSGERIAAHCLRRVGEGVPFYLGPICVRDVC